MKKSVNLFVMTAAVLTVCLTGGCGIKPGNVAAPQGEEKDEFPRTYPDPSTFPRPESR